MNFRRCKSQNFDGKVCDAVTRNPNDPRWVKYVQSCNVSECVIFNRCDLPKVPEGLTKLFPNMKTLNILNSNLLNLGKADLVEYKNLREIHCNENQLDFLPGDLFEGFKELELITFSGNILKVIEPNILDGLDKLKHVDFRSNPNFDKCFSIYPDSRPNATLDEVKNELFEKFLSSGSENVQKFTEKFSNYPRLLKKPEVDWPQKVQDQASADSSIVSDFKHHIQDDNFKDFKIDIDGREFPVHKFLLAARSPTLAEMLRNSPEAENLKLVKIPVEVFEVILKFLYTDELPGSDDFNFLHLFAAASRLEIKKLVDYSAVKVLNQVNIENVLEILELSNKHGHDGLRQKSFEEIKKKYPKIEFKDEWVTDTEKVLKMIEIFRKFEALEREFSALKD